MALRRVSRSATVLISAAVVTCASSVAALADNPPPGQVLSNFENHYGANIVRDCGYSQPLPADPGSSLWLLCDTDVYRFNAQGQPGLTGSARSPRRSQALAQSFLTGARGAVTEWRGH